MFPFREGLNSDKDMRHICGVTVKKNIPPSILTILLKKSPSLNFWQYAVYSQTIRAYQINKKTTTISQDTWGAKGKFNDDEIVNLRTFQ
jgi:hypothetical protein